eukprot:CAMPEP_0179410524 /NCGR_PEP_ID=MMETSP0799-20121207/3339_1 /TAXON_ID=46947 /ORGANISM="Geminigera cryophila, Strain CCMP2564" /LENGTH=147 /DNA_ID=CAMNT_0021182391 /DNA_START=93 /DNA_END=536 /DNA_ORIENTATION=+
MCARNQLPIHVCVLKRVSPHVCAVSFFRSSRLIPLVSQICQDPLPLSMRCILLRFNLGVCIVARVETSRVHPEGATQIPRMQDDSSAKRLPEKGRNFRCTSTACRPMRAQRTQPTAIILLFNMTHINSDGSTTALARRQKIQQNIFT